MAFIAPRWKILHPEAYRAARRTLLVEWSFVCTLLVGTIVGGAWLSQRLLSG